MISIYPKFYDAFKCKGADCKNTCCQKWEIDIDADSVARYESMPGPLGDDVRAAMTVTDGVHHFKFNKDGKCPLLQDGLCRIVLDYGEDGLCDICHMHPRFFKYIGELELCGVGLSCEESCELLMGIAFDEQVIGEDSDMNTYANHEMHRSQNQNLEFIIPGIEEIYHIEDIIAEIGIELPTEDFQFEPIPSAEDYSMLFDIMSGLEALSPKWSEQLHELTQNPEMATVKTAIYWEHCNQSMFNRLYQYILYRQLDQVTEHYPDSVVAYARDSTEFILICSAVFGEPLIQTALWSEQIEYDEDNVELLFNTYDEI